MRRSPGTTQRRSTAGWPAPNPRGIARGVIVTHMMKVSAGESAPTADKEDTRLASVDTERIMTKNKQPNKQVEQIKLLLRVRKIEKEKQERE